MCVKILFFIILLLEIWPILCRHQSINKISWSKSPINEIYFENCHTWCVSGLRVEHAPCVSWPALVPANERRPCVKMSAVFRWTVLVLLCCALLLTVFAADSKQKPKKNKDIRDYNDADMARLLEQWEVRYSGGFPWKLLHMSAVNHSTIKHFMLWI